MEYNIGIGQGYSILQVISAFEKANNPNIPYQIEARRPGDVAAIYADTSFTKEVLGWQAKYALPDMIQQQRNWQKNNPHGYEYCSKNNMIDLQQSVLNSDIISLSTCWDPLQFIGYKKC